MQQSRHFFPLWAQLIKEDLKNGEYLNCTPWLLALCIFVAYFITRNINQHSPRSDIITVLASLLTVAGVCTAIIINAMQQFAIAIAQPVVATAAVASGSIQHYLFFFVYFQGSTITSLLLMTFALIFQITDLGAQHMQNSIFVALTGFFYTIIQTLSSVILTRDLASYQALAMKQAK